MTPQQQANLALAIWQAQRLAGIPAEQRQIPDDAFNRNIEPIRQLLERNR